MVAHIYLVDGLWLSVMSGDPFQQTKEVIDGIKNKLSDRSLKRMKALYSELAGRYDSFLFGHNELDQELTVEHPSYGRHRFAVSAMVEHVVNHGSYHRGNITAMLRQQGQAGIPTDYIFYLHQLSKEKNPSCPP